MTVRAPDYTARQLVTRRNLFDLDAANIFNKAMPVAIERRRGLNSAGKSSSGCSLAAFVRAACSTIAKRRSRLPRLWKRNCRR
jgi:hypothetical protein